MVELLSPAGDIEKLKMAIHYGADAIYIGGQNYSLRANAKNFSYDEMKEAVKLVHAKDKKLYVTVNIVFHDEDFVGLEDYLLFLDEIGIDAIMVSDIAVLDLCNKLNLKLERYISTQASILNSKAALFYKTLGATRVVLAREAMEEDVKSIKKEADISIEAFVHGAMCTSFSGRCILSNYVTNRDSNRGGCAQICRWNFTLKDKNDKLVDNNFWIASKDLNMIEYIQDMANSGIYSFKIEGRMRSTYYIATVLHSYRLLLDMVKNNQIDETYVEFIKKVLNRCANRETAPQFFKNHPTEEEQYYLSNIEEVSNQDFLGIVLENKNGIITIEQRNYFKLTDEVQFFGPNIDCLNYKITNIYDEKDNEIQIANHPQMIIKIKEDLPLSPGDMMRLKIFDK
ncbi:MAG: U32 family peptidase [Bacilli bacterium]|nr:U32 family peptidase [Bacilli bacterium]